MSYIGTNAIYFNKPPMFRFHRPMAAKKNIFDNFNEEDSILPAEDAIKVFLRLKPTESENDVIQILDSKTVLFKMPPEFMQARNKLNMPDQYKYSFSHIYRPDTTQSEIYTGCVAPLIKNLFSGDHCLLFTYGTTNAGKTFTVLGTGDHPGVIPRTLTTVFKSIAGKEYNNPHIMPDKFNSALEVTERTLQEELKFKETILLWNHNKYQADSKLYKTQSTTIRSSVDDIFGESVFKEMQKRLTNDTSIVEYEADSEDRFSVWVSFAEIYNEAIYDLLQPVLINSKRKQLKLAQDHHKNYYIKGLKQVFVRSEEEAYKVLMFGKTNLQVAATGMNSRSSRSHCIFTIKLIKSPNVEHPEQVVVSSFSICDLAGAERQKKTLNVGLRLKESQNINCSLHVLSRCFNVIRENQLSTEQKMIPFRDSKLTQLFKHALTGKESVTMIVNVNSDRLLCEETQHVLKASAIAKHIVVQPRKAKRPQRDTRQSLFSQIIIKHDRSTGIRWDSCVKPKAPELSLEPVEETKKNELEDKQEKYENVLSLVEDLKEKLKEEKTKHLETKRNWQRRENEIRGEMMEEVTKMVEKAKQENVLDSKKAEDAVKEIENKKRKLVPKNLAIENGKTNSHEEENGLDQSIEIKDLQTEVKMQQKQIDGLTDLVNILRDEKKELRMDLTMYQLKLSHKEREIENLKTKIEMFGEESAMHKKYLDLEKEMEGKLAFRDDLLNEAKEDLLAEMRAKEDLEEEITKFEKELTEKDEEVLTLQSQIEDLKSEVSDKEDQIDLLDARIEDMEYRYGEEIKLLKSKCCNLEEEIVHLNLQQQNSDSSEGGSKEDLDKEIASLSLKIDQLVCENKSLAESLAVQENKFCALKQDSADKLNSVERTKEEEVTKTRKAFEEQLAERDKQIKKLQEEIETWVQNQESINTELQNKIAAANSYKENLDKAKEEYLLEKSKLQNKIVELTQKIEEKDELSLLVPELKSQCQVLQEGLQQKTEELEKLQKSIDSITQSKKKIEEECNSEISTLEQNLKKQIQETTNLWTSQREKERENEKLSKELSKLKKVLAGLNVSLKNKEHDVECWQNKITGYEQTLPALQEQFELQRKELSEYKARCEAQVETIINMEKDLDSFQVNQREINGKYEEQLKKTKEENEALKKEVARVTTTFYKSTPTPKKVLEKQIEEQKAHLKDLQLKLEDKELGIQKLQQEKDIMEEKLVQISQSITEGPDKENINTSEHGKNDTKRSKLKLKTTKDNLSSAVRSRTQSCDDDLGRSSDLETVMSKSISKSRSRKARAAGPAIVVTDFDASTASIHKPADVKNKSRKKLYDRSMDNYDQHENIEMDCDFSQESPGTNYKRTLRNRNK